MMVREAKTISAARVRELLNYDPEAGLFWWKTSGKGRKEGLLAGTVNKVTGYVVLRVDRKDYQAHRLAWLCMTGELPDKQIDHINRNRLDNRFANLRVASNRQNAANGRARSGNFKGVHWATQISRWRARITVNGKSISLGCYGSDREAALAYDVAARKYFGEFAHTNFRAEDA